MVGQKKGFRHSEKSKKQIAETIKRKVSEGSKDFGKGFLKRINCPHCNQETSVANAGLHMKACEQRNRLQYLFSKPVTVRNIKSWKINLKLTYGLTTDHFEEMFNKQKGLCRICGGINKSTKMLTKLVVDHCHSTGKIRGLLCDSCNWGLGVFQDNPDLLQKAKEYLNDSN